MNSEELFGTTPPRPRLQKKKQEIKNIVTNRHHSHSSFDKDTSRGRCLHRKGSIPSQNAKKRQTEVRSNQRDLKTNNMDVFSNEVSDTVPPIISKAQYERKQRLASVSSMSDNGTITIQYSHNLRCLKSQMSSGDLMSLIKNPPEKPTESKPPNKRMKSAPKLKTNRSFNKRISYMRTIDKLLKGNTQKRAENVKHNSATDMQYHSQWNELIWLELQAWHSEQDVIETDSRLYSARRDIIPELLNFIGRFSFNSECLKELDDMVNRFKIILKEIPEADCEDCDVYTEFTTANPAEQFCNFDSFSKSCKKAHNSLNSVSDCDASTLVALNQNNIKENNSFAPSKIYLQTQDIAIHKVGEILKELCNIENMYPSTSALSKDYPSYNSPEVQEKVAMLCGWFNITVDLRIKFSHIVKTFMSIKEHLKNTSSDDYDCGCEKHQLHSYNHELESNFRSLFGMDVHNINDDDLKVGVAHMAERMLRQHSVTKIMEIYLSHHLSSMVKVRKHIMPIDTNHTSFAIGDETNHHDSTDEKDFDISYTQFSSRIKEVLPNFDLSVVNIQATCSVESDVLSISPTNKHTAVFELPSLIPIYSFLPSGLLNLMKECIHLRLKQTKPDLLNRGSSSSLLTARQFVTEYKEMLECGLLARDIFTFFIVDTHCCQYYANEQSDSNELTEFNSNMFLMLNVYMQYMQLWLVGLLSDLPLAPRSFKSSLEQEWNFACHISPKISFESVLICVSKFTETCSKIVESTEKFLITAIDTIIESHNQEQEIIPKDEQLNTPEIKVSPSRQGSYTSSGSGSVSSELSDKRHLKAGVLWYHRQRSDSPHLSRKIPSSPLTPLVSSTEVSPIAYRQYSFTSQDSSNSLRLTPNTVETQRRYHFELCRAVKELFNEVRERALRILSFSKQLRKKLEPAIGFNLLDIEDMNTYTDSKLFCAHCQLYNYFSMEGYVKLNFKNLLPHLKTTKKLFNLEDYDIFLPTTRGDQSCASPRNNDPEKKIWDKIKNVIFSHLELSANEVNEQSFKDAANWMIFLKKCKKDEIPLQNNSNDRSPSPRLQHIKNTVKKSRRSSSGQFGNNKNKGKLQKGKKCSSDGTLLKRDHEDLLSCQSESCLQWNGEDIDIYSTEASKIKIFQAALEHFKLEHDFTAILASADDLSFLRKDLTKSLSMAAKVAVGQMSVVNDVINGLNCMREQIVCLGSTIMNTIIRTGLFLHGEVDDTQINCGGNNSVYESQQQVRSEINEVMQSCYNFGFDFIKEASRIMNGKYRMEMDELHIEFAKKWMKYVRKYRSTGTGHMPRWAVQGLKFVVSVEWSFIKGFTDQEFDEFRFQIDGFISHVIGEKPKPKQIPEKTVIENSLLSVIPSDHKMLRSLSNTSVTMNKDAVEQHQFKASNHVPSFTIDSDSDSEYDDYETPIERVRRAIEDMDEDIDLKKQEDRIIGKITDSPRPMPVVNLGVRTVNFQWQRGTKIGEGSFGKVYTCVNVDTGVILAMKEIQFQANDHQRIRSILDEITIFEGIQHRNLVQNYGVELHRQEMYIFMEFCDGGTLEEICRLGLPETMIRRYTAQILSALSVLHANGIVHRDIKGSNVFLTTSGLAKLGDFGSSLKLKNKHKTLPNEISSHIGTTTAYTAPEVINSIGGYGRASDIWSLGCVVVEMASGKRPWHDLEPVQIMFKVGNENAPTIPENLSPEGQNFLTYCLNPKAGKRWSCDKLKGHPFVKVISLD